MAAVETKQIPLGFKAPGFKLTDVISGQINSLDSLKSEKATVIMFICNHCPYVIHVQEALVRLADEYIPKGVSFIAISSNDAKNYPEDSPERMKQVARRFHFPFSYLYDETQDVAKAYFAVCTPEFNVFDCNLKCVYRGQMDDSRPGNRIPVTGIDLRKALDALLKGEKVNPLQKPSIGCSIKWKK